MNNPRVTRQNIDPERLRKIQEEHLHRQLALALRIRLQHRKELCNIAIAAALLDLVFKHNLPWSDVARTIHGISSRSHAHRLAHRKVGCSKESYERISKAINAYLHSQSLPLIDFPLYDNDITIISTPDGV